jgi:intein/homing endonuclease
MPHFIRGIFDGDGCLNVKQSKNTKALNVGIYFPDVSFLKSLNYYLGFLNIKGHIEKTKTCYYLSYKKDRNIMKHSFLNYIYSNSSIFLHRKKELYESINFNGRYFY